jgi:Ca2+-binding RTX toxin-like protein
MTIGLTAAVAAPVAAGGGVSAELGSGAAKRGTLLALTLEGTGGADTISVATSSGDIVVSVPAPATIDGPDECTQNTPQQFTCDSSLGIDGVIGRLGGGPDRFNAKELTLLTNQYGGRGNDRLLGGTKFDFLNGGRGNNDTCKGFHGKETIKNCE